MVPFLLRPLSLSYDGRVQVFAFPRRVCGRVVVAGKARVLSRSLPFPRPSVHGQFIRFDSPRVCEMAMGDENRVRGLRYIRVATLAVVADRLVGGVVGE